MIRWKLTLKCVLFALFLSPALSPVVWAGGDFADPGVLLPTKGQIPIEDQRPIGFSGDVVSSEEILRSSSLFEDQHKVVSIERTHDLAAVLRQMRDLPRKSIDQLTGYHDTRVWMLFSIQNHSPENQLILRYAYPQMQRIGLYVYDEDGNPIGYQASGKAVPFAERPVDDTEYLFKLSVPQGRRYTVAMRFETSGSMQFPVSIFSTSKLHGATQARFLLYGFYYGVMFLILIYSVFLALTGAGPLYGAYLFYNVSVLFAQICLQGVGYRFLWPTFHHWNMISAIFSIGLMFFALTIFTSVALETRTRARHMHRVLVAFGVASVAIMSLSCFLYGPMIIRLTGLVASSLPIVVLPIGLLAWRRGVSFARYYTTAVLFYITGASLYGLRDTGVLPYNFVTENGVLLGSLVEISIFSLGIAARIREMKRNSDQMKSDFVVASALAAVAARVSHDIRSPLVALEMVSTDLEGISEEKRVVLRGAVARIKDIANDLLKKNREGGLILHASYPPEDSALPVAPTLLASLLDEIITEKRIEFRAQIDLEINLTLATNGFGVFSMINSRELKRIVSNLINNAVEAIEGAGQVSIHLNGRDGFAELTIEDNGKGMSPRVLSLIEKSGGTYGKPEGNGMGLSHARKLLSSWGGSLKIRSTEGKGTSVALELPRTDPPRWFVPELLLRHGTAVAVYDDDVSIHAVWKKRLESMVRAGEITLDHFSRKSDFTKWVVSTRSKGGSFMAFVDFELMGEPSSGLDAIGELGIQRHAMLVTSHYENEEVVRRCTEQDIRLIPKFLAAQVPISMTGPIRGAAATAAVVVIDAVDAVLLDDDPLVHMTWEISARENGLVFKGFRSAADFLADLKNFDPSTPIYIDAELGDGEKGEEVAKIASARGYSNVFLATGHDPQRFAKVSWIRRVVGKMPPWTAAIGMVGNDQRSQPQ